MTTTPIIPLADLIADLRTQPTTIAAQAAADRLEEMGAELAPLHDAWLKAKPPCPTCDGDGCFHEERMHSGGDVAEMITGHCPDCPDGVQPFDKWTAGLVALWEGAHPEGCCGECSHYSHSNCIACGKSDAECMAILWPEAASLRQIDDAR